MAAFFVSDIHLHDGRESDARLLVNWLNSLSLQESEEVGDLFFVGDIFDLWIGAHRYFVQKYPDLIEAVRKVVQSGVRVHFFAGNHDLYLEKFWQKELGVQVYNSAQVFEIEGTRVRVEHGDLINPDDRGYLFLKSVLEARSIRWLAENLPSVVIRKIGERASQMSRQHTSSAKALPEEKIRNLVRTFAQKTWRDALQENRFDLLITGHVHVRDDFRFQLSSAESSAEVRSINLGSWHDGAKALRLSRGQIEFIDLEQLRRS